MRVSIPSLPIYSPIWHDCKLTHAILKAGANYILIVKQDATGSRTLSYDTVYKFPSGTSPVLTTTANATDIIHFYCDGISMYGYKLSSDFS